GERGGGGVSAIGAIRGELDRRQIGDAEASAREALAICWDDRRPARPGEADDVEDVGESRERPPEQRCTDPAVALLVGIDQEDPAFLDQVAMRAARPGDAV